jgi:CRP-like cAMP-binding protein
MTMAMPTYRADPGLPAIAAEGLPDPRPPAEVNFPQAAWIACCLGRGSLAPLDPDDIADLVAELGERRYPAGSLLFRMGEAPARVHIVHSGTVELSRELNGRRVVLQILAPGDVVGDISLFIRMAEAFDARALEDSVVLTMDSLALCSLLQRRPRLARRWLVSVSLRTTELQARLVDLLAGGLEAQLASILIRHAEQGVVHLNQAILAQLVGGWRTSVNRVLKHMEARAVIRLRYGQVEVLDPAALAIVAGLVKPLTPSDDASRVMTSPRSIHAGVPS